MSSDAIAALQSIGYTEREAAFLYLVAVYSGYFLRRQFDYFIDRHKGAIAARFLEKARQLGHIRLLDSGPGRQVYHLFHRPIYRLIGNPESQNRRIKSDIQVRARLMMLDYVLENGQDHYLTSSMEKRDFLQNTRGIDQRLLLDSRGRLKPILESISFSLADRMNPSSSIVRILFIDEGLLTTTKFERFLDEAKPVLIWMGHFALVYIATSDHNFAGAARLFRRTVSQLTGPTQVQLHPDWRTGSGPNQGPTSAQNRAQFVTVLLTYGYPQVQRNEMRGSHDGSHYGSQKSD